MATGLLPNGKAAFRIKEAAEIVEVAPSVLRFWETEFPWINPERDGGGRRRYSRRNVEDLLVIKKMLHEDKYTIAGAKKLLGQARRTEGGVENLRSSQRSKLANHDDLLVLQNVKKELLKMLEMLG